MKIKVTLEKDDIEEYLRSRLTDHNLNVEIQGEFKDIELDVYIG